MPGAGIDDFKKKAKLVGDVGVYNVGIHVDQILKPVLFKHWKIKALQGRLQPGAEATLEGTKEHVEKVENVAVWMGQLAAS